MRKIILLIAVLAVLVSACQMEKVGISPAYAANFNIVGSKPGNLSLGVLDNTVKILQDEYYKEFSANNMLEGGIFGINELLKDKKLGKPLPPLSAANSYAENLKKLEEVINQVEAKYPKLSKVDVVYYALNGMLFTLKDPYTVALTPKEANLFDEQMNGGNFTGVGIYIELDKNNHNQLTVMEPIEGTPAEKAGLKSGDEILSINGESSKGMPIDVASQKIRGPQGSTAVLNIKRKGEAVRDYNIKREFIHVSSAVAKMYKGNVGYIKLRVFGENTQQEFGKCLDEIEKAGARSLVIDLRNNGGGYVQAAIDVCSFFLPAGTLITSVVEPRAHKTTPYNAFKANTLDLPMVILINRYSASASEIVAGAFKDHKAAALIGEKSFGKGSVQSMFNLPDGGALKYTIAHYHTPSGLDIHEKGINPDVLVKMDPKLVGDKKADLQLIKAIKILKEKTGGSARN